MATKKSVIDTAINSTNPNKASKARKPAATNKTVTESSDKALHEKRLMDEKTGKRERDLKDAIKSRIDDRKADKEKNPVPAPIVNIEPPKDLTNPPKKDKMANVAGLQTVSFQTYAMTPTSGKMLWALTNAVLTINGQMGIGKRPFVPKGNIVNFYSSSTILRHHIKNGHFEENDRGFVRLTVSGFNYFKARVNGMNKNQQISKDDIDNVMAMLKGPAIKNKTRECKIIQSV